MKLAVPDLITNSYFPVVAAAELGFFKKEGLDLTVELVAPAGRTYEALRDGEADFVAAEAHAGLAAFLVMRADLARERGDVSVVRGRRIAAAPWVELCLRRLLIEAGIDPEKDDVRIALKINHIDMGVAPIMDGSESSSF